MSTVATIAYWVVLAAAWGGLQHEREGGTPLRPSVPSLLLWGTVALPSVVQLTVAPSLLDIGQRESGPILDGQLWRLVTSLVLQDGGWFGAISNLAILAVTLVLVAPVLTGWRLVAVFVGGGVVANLLTVATFGQSGAGCSMATIVLAVTALGLVSRRPRVLTSLVVAASALVLLLQHDQHGLAAAAGLVMGAVAQSPGLRRAWRSPGSTPPGRSGPPRGPRA